MRPVLSLQFLSQLRAVENNLLLGPALKQTSHEGDMALNIGENAQVGETANFLETIILGPVSDRDLDRLGLDINETSLLHAFLLQVTWKRREDTTEFLGALVEELAPFRNGAAGLDAVIVAETHGVTLVGLDPTAGRGYLKCALVQGVPVGDAAVEEAHVDEVG